jgi:hypothetical protein
MFPILISPRARKRGSVALSGGPERDASLRRARSSAFGEGGPCKGREVGIVDEVGREKFGVEVGTVNDNVTVEAVSCGAAATPSNGDLSMGYGMA